MTTKPVETMNVPAYENKLFFKGIKDAPSSSSVDSKTPTITQAEVMERHNSLNNAQEAFGCHIVTSFPIYFLKQWYMKFHEVARTMFMKYHVS